MMQYDCTIDKRFLRCIIVSDKALTTPVFCCSAMAPLVVTEGATFVKRVGSYTEVKLPNIKKQIPYKFTLEYADGFIPANRAWLPLGPYLRTQSETIKLPPTEAGYKPLGPKEKPIPFTGLRLIPQVDNWQPDNNTLAIKAIRLDSEEISNGALHAVAKLADRRRLGKLIDADGIPALIQQSSLPKDCYRIKISTDSIFIEAGSYGGFFYAGITLLTLIRNHDGNIPCGTLNDCPRFEWRGQHLDTARHFYHVSTISDLLDLMALMKLNRFHWHFADDEAFRLQIDCYPELWQQTQMRGEGHLLPAIFSAEIEAGGSYSKDEVQQLIEHARALNIEIMPEVEVPAHALALARIFPDTLDPEDTGTATSVQGYRNNVLNPAMPLTWTVVNNIVEEIGALFPFNHLHLGCDELPENAWADSPCANELMSSHGLESQDDLSGWMIAKLAKTVSTNGQRPAAWEEAARGSNGGIGNNALLFTWTGQGPGIEAARNGYDVVMCPAQHVYLDMAHTNDADDWGANWAAYISLADTIAWEPIPDPALADRIIGVQGQFWSEFTTSDEQMWPMLLPRILGIATKAWQNEDISLGALSGLSEYYEYNDLNFS